MGLWLTNPSFPSSYVSVNIKQNKSWGADNKYLSIYTQNFQSIECHMIQSIIKYLSSMYYVSKSICSFELEYYVILPDWFN